MITERLLITFLRWRTGEPSAGREITQVESGNPMAACDCPFCDLPLTEHLPARLLVLGPGDPEAQDRLRENRWHMATAIAVHDACIGEDMAGRRFDGPFDTVDQVRDLLNRLGLSVY